MIDDFIYKALPAVPQAFSQSLYARISAEGESQRKVPFPLRRLRWLHVSTIALSILIVVAWSQLRFWVRYVPVGDLWLIEFNRSTQISPDSQPAIPFVPTPMATYDWTRTLPTEEFETFFTFYVPSWIPDGFRDIENLDETTFWDSSRWIWANDAGERIRLSCEGKAGGMRPYAPSGMWKQVYVNDDPALLIYGRLALRSSENPRSQRKWDEQLGLQLHWRMGECIYALETYGPYVSEQDLIRMAESAQPLRPWDPTPTP